MTLMLVLGLFALGRMTTQFFPDFGIDVVTVSVQWPGASAEDLDDNVVQAIEPEVRFLDGVDTVTSSSFEGRAAVAVEFEAGTDMQKALSDVENAVAQVTTLPENSERPVIKRFTRYDSISRVVLSGPYSEEALNAFATEMRDDLLTRGIDKVDIAGKREEEIWVEVLPETLRRLDMTLGDVAERIASISQDIPSGDTAGAVERQIRSEGQLTTAREIAGIEIKSLEGGQKVFLRDVAEVSESFEEGGITLRRGDHPAVELHVQRSTNADALELADTVDGYLAEVAPSLPRNLAVEQYDVQADLIRSRIQLLLKNGAGGLVLVLAVLFLFLRVRVGFWVAMGIPVSMMGTMVVMLASGQSINMVSLFGMIMALGIIVDDAIVVGEHTESRFRGGLPALEAAERGAGRMAAPVLSSSLTTIAAFLPLFMISDVIGQIIQAIPLVIVSIIVASLIECFLVLPGHLHHTLTGRDVLAAGARARQWLTGLQPRPSRLRAGFDRRFEAFRDGPFTRFVAKAVEYRYATLATALAAFVLALGVVAGGRVGFVFFPAPEVDKFYGNVEFAAGTPRDVTSRQIEELERALADAEQALTGGEGALIEFTLATIGVNVGLGPTANPVTGDHAGGLTVELVGTEQRDITAAEVMREWRERARLLPGLVGFTVRPAQAGPPGRDVDVRLTGDDIQALKQAAAEVKALLGSYPGVSDIEDDLPYGKIETLLELTPRGRAMGFTTQSVGSQVRDAFQGAIAKRFARGDEEVEIRVQYPRRMVDLAALDSLYLRGPGGAEVPLSSVVTLREDTGFARIRREDGRRQVAITAELDLGVTTTNEVTGALLEDGLADIAQEHGASFVFKGKSEEQEETFADMRGGAAVGLITIFIILAWVFGSYARPAVVMLIIPLGFVGAVVGHMLLGFDLTILSMVALIGLAGIVVNNSIILVSVIDERLADGQSLMEAIVGGACDRVRAVILTTTTTIGGLTPLMFETDLQAQFLIPMAITIVFGLLVATLMVLVVVPALLGVGGDLARLTGRGPGRTVQPAE